MRRLLALCVTLATLWLYAGARRPAEARWFKGNTHTHTLWSDGDAAPELVADWYASHGYDFLVLSDHNVLSRGERWFPVGEGRLTPAKVAELGEHFGGGWVEEREVDGKREMRLKTLEELRERFGELLFIEGEEITDSFEGHPVHVNGLNLQEPIQPQGGTSLREVLQRNVDAVLAQARETGRPMLAHINHPNFQWGLTPEDVASVKGERFFEVYNGHSAVRNYGDAEHPSCEEMWDIALVLRLRELDLPPLLGLATDDAHEYFDWGVGETNPGRGWVMVRAEEKSPDAIVRAMKRGDFYASSGVTLERVEHKTWKHLEVEIAAEEGVEYTTRFIGTRTVDGEPGEIGELLLETKENPARYEFAGDELYVRAKVISSRAHPNPYAEGDRECAWVQPVTRPLF